MRILSGNDQIAVLVCFRSSHQGVRRQLLIVGILNNGTVVQTKDEALAGNDLDHLMNHAVFQVRDLGLFLFLFQRDLNRQIRVGCGDFHFNHSGFLINRSQSEVAALSAVHIAIRRGNFHQVVLAQRKQTGFHGAGTCSRQRFDLLIFCVEGGSFLTNDVLRCMQLKLRTSKVSVFIHRLHNRIAVGVSLILEPNQLEALLFKDDISANRSICHVQRDCYSIIRQGSWNSQIGQQHDQCHKQMKKTIFHTHCLHYLIQTFTVYPESRYPSGTPVSTILYSPQGSRPVSAMP